MQCTVQDLTKSPGIYTSTKHYFGADKCFSKVQQLNCTWVSYLLLICIAVSRHKPRWELVSLCWWMLCDATHVFWFNLSCSTRTFLLLPSGAVIELQTKFPICFCNARRRNIDQTLLWRLTRANKNYNCVFRSCNSLFLHQSLLFIAHLRRCVEAAQSSMSIGLVVLQGALWYTARFSIRFELQYAYSIYSIKRRD